MELLQKQENAVYYLKDSETKEILDSRTLSGNKIMVLHHTKFMHDVKGVGELVVFGLSKKFDTEKFFKNVNNLTFFNIYIPFTDG